MDRAVRKVRLTLMLHLALRVLAMNRINSTSLQASLGGRSRSSAAYSTLRGLHTGSSIIARHRVRVCIAAVRFVFKMHRENSGVVVCSLSCQSIIQCRCTRTDFNAKSIYCGELHTALVRNAIRVPSSWPTYRMLEVRSRSNGGVSRWPTNAHSVQQHMNDACNF